MKLDQRKAGVILSYILIGSNAAIGFIYIPLLLYFLGKEEFGLYQLMGSILIYMSLFDFGLSNTITRYYSKFMALNDEKGKENLLALSTIIYSGITLLLVLTGIFIYFFIDEIFGKTLSLSEAIIAKKMFIIILINVAITIPSYIFNSVITSHERFVFLKGLSIVQTILRPFVVYAVFSIQASALILVIIQTVINVVGIIIKIYYSFKKIKVRIKFHNWDKSLLKEMLKYSFFIFITALMDQIFWRSDQIILGIIIGTSSVAIYSIASQIITNYMYFSTAISGVFLPSITQKVVNNVSNNELTNIFIKVGRLQYLLLGGVICGFMIFGEEFILLWVGQEFKEAFLITIIIMIPFTIDLIQNIGLTILQAKNLYSFRATIFFMISILNVTLSIPLAIKFGAIGAAFSTSISFLIGNGLIMNLYYYRKLNIDIIKFWREIFQITIPMSATLLLAFFINYIGTEPSLYSFVIKLLFFVFTYFIVMWSFGMNKFEKELFINPIKKILVKRIH